MKKGEVRRQTEGKNNRGEQESKSLGKGFMRQQSKMESVGKEKKIQEIGKAVK